MADFAKTAEIISRCMGYEDNAFIDAFDNNIQLQVQEAISANFVASAIVKFMEDKDKWEGTATALLTKLETVEPN